MIFKGGEHVHFLHKSTKYIWLKDNNKHNIIQINIDCVLRMYNKNVHFFITMDPLDLSILRRRLCIVFNKKTRSIYLLLA